MKPSLRDDYFLGMISGDVDDIGTLTPPVAVSDREKLMLKIADKAKDILDGSLPKVTTTDAGKVLTVSEEGKWAPQESGRGLPDPSTLGNGTALVAVNGEWKMMSGLPWEGSVEEITMSMINPEFVPLAEVYKYHNKLKGYMVSLEEAPSFHIYASLYGNVILDKDVTASWVFGANETVATFTDSSNNDWLIKVTTEPFMGEIDVACSSNVGCDVVKISYTGTITKRSELSYDLYHQIFNRDIKNTDLVPAWTPGTDEGKVLKIVDGVAKWVSEPTVSE